MELRWLRTPEGQPVTEDAISNPAHWAVLLDEEIGFVDRESGETVEEDSIDWATEDDAEPKADEGLRHFSTVIEKTVYAPVWFCIDYQGAGLDLEAFLKNARPVVHGEDQPTNLDADEDEAWARREARTRRSRQARAPQGAGSQQVGRCGDDGTARVRAQAAGESPSLHLSSSWVGVFRMQEMQVRFAIGVTARICVILSTPSRR